MNEQRVFFRMPVLLTIVIVLSMVLSGCGGGAPATKVVAVATETLSATAAPSNTPKPTSTATPVPTETATMTPTATLDYTATAEVEQAATQTAINEMVGAELTKLGIDSTKGHVKWVMGDPVELDGSGYAQGWYVPIKNLGTVKNFVMQTRVYWDTSGALAGCAYLFRAPEDWSLDTGDFYELSIIRIKYAPVWMIDYYDNGRWQYSIPGGRGVTSKNLLDEEKTENVLTLDAKGDQLTIYVNGVKERTVVNNKVEEGSVAFEVVQNSGTSYCRFSDGWIWEYDE